MDVILDIIDHVFDWLGTVLFAPFATDAMYRRGVFTALAFGFAVSKVLTAVLTARAKIRAFFQPSALPATRPGASGYDRARGCGMGFVTLILVSIIFILLLSFVGVALTRR